MRRDSQLREPTGALGRPAGVDIVVALKAEARPLVTHYGLRAAPPCAGCVVYHRDQLRLIVSGVGSTSAATATNQLSRLCGQADGTRAWLNIGLAGHGQLPPGSLLAASKVIHRATGRHWILTPVLDPTLCPASTVVTVDSVERNYDPPDCAFEMEAAGFCQEALQAAPPAWVGCLKVVSDGPHHAPEQLNAKVAKALLAQHLDRIDRAIHNLMSRGDGTAESWLEPVPP